MSIREVTMYRVECDWPGCTASPQDDSEYFAWSNKGDAEEYATDANWRVGRAGMCHYCPEHPSEWASDHEHGEPYPEPPYLLIHDGDTDSDDDDGRVTFVTVAS